MFCFCYSILTSLTSIAGQEISRNSSGYNSNSSNSSISLSSQASRRSTAAFNVYKLPEFAHVKSKVDTGLTFCPSNSSLFHTYFLNDGQKYHLLKGI